MRFRGRTAVVTGGGSGIGRAIAERLGQEGAHVVVIGRRLAQLDEAVQRVTGAGGSAHAMVCDVADADAVKRCMDAAAARTGRLDVLVNGAATNRPDEPVIERVAELPEAWWQDTLGTTLGGVFHCCKAALPHMVAAGGGTIVNIASTSGLTGNWNQSAYVAAKHGVVGLTRAIALDYAAHGVRANVVCPGFIETERSLRFSKHNRGADWQARKLAEIPLGRLGQPAEVASLVAFVASDEAAYLTGAVLPLDGGTAARRG